MLDLDLQVEQGQEWYEMPVEFAEELFGPGGVELRWF